MTSGQWARRRWNWLYGAGLGVVLSICGLHVTEWRWWVLDVFAVAGAVIAHEIGASGLARDPRQMTPEQDFRGCASGRMGRTGSGPGDVATPPGPAPPNKEALR